MANLLLDTNVLVHMVREKKTYFETKFGVADPKNDVFISAVSIGEMESLSIRRKWGKAKIELMNRLFQEFLAIDINNEFIFKQYAEIEAYSLSQHPSKRLPIAAKTLGKNDLWIAATASVINATLITSDADFDHLDNEYLHVALFKPADIV